MRMSVPVACAVRAAATVITLALLGAGAVTPASGRRWASH